MKKRIVSLLLVGILFFSGLCYGAEEEGDTSQALQRSAPVYELPDQLLNIAGIGGPPQITGETAILIDAGSGQILYNKDMHGIRFPASTTKMITGLLALENLDLEEQVVVDTEASFTTGSRIYLIEGEEVTVEELLYAMMLVSANDAAVSLAKTVSGSVEEFAKMMNERAKAAGAINTNFVNSNGLPDDAHVTTAYDLAMIAREAMRNEMFRDIVDTSTYQMGATNKQPSRTFNNSNRLLNDSTTKFDKDGELIVAKYEGATGIKTGSTNAAGSCLVASAKRDDQELIAVILKSTAEQIFVDAIKLLDYGFQNYDGKVIVKKDFVAGVAKIKDGAVKQLDAVTADQMTLSLPQGTSWKKVDIKEKMLKNLTAPIQAGQKLGTLVVSYDGKEIGSMDLIAPKEVMTAEDAKAAGLIVESGFTASGTLFTVLKFVGIAAVILVILLIGFVLVVNHLYEKKRRKRKAQKRQRQREERERQASLEHRSSGRYLEDGRSYYRDRNHRE